MRQVDEVRLRGVVEQTPELFTDVGALGGHEIGHVARMLGHVVEAAAVPTEAALVC
jgi:hypothetical protein